MGLGIRYGQMTLEAKQAIQDADVIFTVANNFVSEYFLDKLNPNVVVLKGLYGEGKKRMDTYHEMVDTVLAAVREGKKVCFATYGHAGVFAYPTHTAVARAREEGYPSVMLAGVSAEDCIFADLGIDPGTFGCQSFDATDFLVREPAWDPHTTLILWQVSVAGIMRLAAEGEIPPGVDFLIPLLVGVYGEDHPAILYEAPPYPLCAPRKDEVRMADLKSEMFRPMTTMVIKPIKRGIRKNREFAKLIH